MVTVLTSIRETIFRDWGRRAQETTVARHILRRYHLRRGKPAWKAVAEKGLLDQRPGAGTKVLIGTSSGGYLAGMTLDSALAAALRLRGAAVHVLLCDSDVPACLECTVVTVGGADHLLDHGPRLVLCPGCFETGRSAFEQIGVVVHRFGDYLTDDDRLEAAKVAASVPLDELGTYRPEGLPIGEHALAGALRFFARATLENEPRGADVNRKFLEAALLTAMVTERLLAAEGFDRVVAHHGIYVPQGIIASVARATGVDVVTWNPAYRSQCFMFSHDDTYHHTLLSEPTSSWDDIAWTPALSELTETYLASRSSGSNDWISFHERPLSDIEMIAEEVGFSLDRPIIGMLTNVMWDAQLHYPANVFQDMREWCMATIRHFAGRPDLQLLLRVHPAEIRGWMKSRQPIAEEIASEFPQLPPNVFIIPPESRVSTYTAMDACDAVLIYGTKTGVELAAAGIPVIVAGEAWIRNKGVSIDISSPSEYFSVLDALPIGARLEPHMRERAMKYAFHFFFRRMIPLEFTEAAKSHSPYRLALKSVSELLPGKSPGLDVICDGILSGTPFIFRAEDFIPDPQSHERGRTAEETV